MVVPFDSGTGLHQTLTSALALGRHRGSAHINLVPFPVPELLGGIPKSLELSRSAGQKENRRLQRLPENDGTYEQRPPQPCPGKRRESLSTHWQHEGLEIHLGDAGDQHQSWLPQQLMPWSTVGPERVRLRLLKLAGQRMTTDAPRITTAAGVRLLHSSVSRKVVFGRGPGGPLQISPRSEPRCSVPLILGARGLLHATELATPYWRARPWMSPPPPATCPLGLTSASSAVGPSPHRPPRRRARKRHALHWCWGAPTAAPVELATAQDRDSGAPLGHPRRQLRVGGGRALPRDGEDEALSWSAYL